MPAIAAPALNPAQLEILKLFAAPLSEKDLADLKTMLCQFLYERLTVEADRAFEAKKYTPATITKWKTERMRRNSQPKIMV